MIDDARSHLSTIKMLRQFYFIDAAGKDQGVNVRNRAKELADLLSDVDKIRAERKKARTTKNKYIGVEGGGSGGFSMSNSMSSGSGSSNRNSGRFGGFGSDSADFGGYNGGSGGVYGDGGGFSGQSRNSGGFHDEGGDFRRGSAGGSQRYQEYDEYDDPAAARSSSATAAPAPRAAPAAAVKLPPPQKKAPEPEVNLLDDLFPATTTTAAPTASKPATTDFDDDFDDFQSATPAPATQSSSFSAFAAPPPVSSFAAPPTTSSFSSFPPAPNYSSFSIPTATPSRPTVTSSASGLSLVQPKPVSTSDQSGMRSVVGFSTPPPPAQTPPPPLSGRSFSSSQSSFPTSTGYHPAQPNYFTSVPVAANKTGSPVASAAPKPKSAGGDAFGNIWNQASLGVRKTPVGGEKAKTPSLQAMAKEKASAGIWGAPAAHGGSAGTGAGGSGGRVGGGLEDLVG